MTDLADLASRVAQACRVLGRLELTHAALGHVSARIPGQNKLLIRARGDAEAGVRYSSDDQVIETDFDGKLTKPAAPGLSVPQEIFIHTEIYKARPDVYSVIHIHPPTPMMFTICHKPILPLYGAFDPSSVRFCFEGIPTYERSILINTPARGAELVKVMDNKKVCLMRGHGITTAAASVEQAALYAIHLNHLAEINYKARLIGEPQPISQEDQDEVRGYGARLDSTPKNGERPTGGDATNWRYYCALTGA